MLSRVGCSEAQQGHGIWGALFSSGTGVHLAPHTQMPSGKLRIFMWELQMPGDDPHSGAPWSVSLAGWRQLLRPLCTQAVISKHPLPGQWAPTGELKRAGAAAAIPLAEPARSVEGGHGAGSRVLWSRRPCKIWTCPSYLTGFTVVSAVCCSF